MQTLIQVGDKFNNAQDIETTITRVMKGRYGLLIAGTNPKWPDYEISCYMPFEFEPIENQEWHDFYRYILPLRNGLKVGVLSLYGAHGVVKDDALEIHEKQFERAITAIRKEQELEANDE